MTPLPWWVLLVSLLVIAVAAHPFEHACVRLCRARDTSPEFAGVCEHQQRPVLQSGGGRFPIQRLFRLCLTPCHGSDLDSQSFDTTETCLAFRYSLIQRLGCSCDSLNYDGNLGEDRWEVEKDQMKEADRWKMLRERADEKQAVAYADLQRQQQLSVESLYKIIAETMAADTEDAVIGNLKTGSPIVESENMDETSVDWEMWCRTQCENGQGGSACHCDIIP
ncbi:uncharacterized protein LOC108630032 [Ceratina calcarata]|uniref:Uncharacterized protein LOC108630032 n=1 Tax=Ceratina calcarata TaxID=156304 RepID=A0AAJ7JBA8_9HYME|nr:uncharacterized protein LOC108630032 [Ceratina calcarata]